MGNVINNIIDNPVKLTLFILFILCLFLLSITFFFWERKRHLKTIEIKILRKFDVLKRLPLKHKIFRVSEIARYNNRYAKDLLVWRTKYEIIYEKKLISCLEVFQKLYQINKATPQKMPKLSVQKIIPLLKEVTLLEEEARRLLEEINSQLQIELLQRDYILAHKKMFNSLREDAIKLQMNVSLDTKKITDFERNIEAMFDEFEDYLTAGNFDKTEQILSNIITSLTIFVEILDNIPQIKTLLTKVVPNKLSLLKDKYVLFNKDENSRDVLKYSFDELTHSIDETKILISKYIDNLQYKKASKKAIEIINQISDFNQTIEHQKGIISCFKKYYKVVIEYINKIERSFNVISRQIEVLRSSSTLAEYEESIYREAMGRTKELTHDTNRLVLEINRNGRDFIEFNKELVRLLENAVVVQEALENVVKIIEKRNFAETEIRKTIHLLEVVLLQAEVRLNQLQYKKLLTKYEKPIMDYRKSLEQVKQLSFDVDNRYEVDEATGKLNRLKTEVLKLFEKIKNNILLDLLAQETLVYAQKYILTNDDVDDQLRNAQIAYRNGDYDGSLFLSLKIINEERGKKK
ncbi:septation ring formation regulator EzrA [Spiroplasma endosymbiont of Stenodema calcarata]|uniref:septation ring formation regulator EzrA n=1 Tax=Spiroplasma endosymbiont of Stenodema calcarata TaxID=3139328 RepID=UPI003CCB67DA